MISAIAWPPADNVRDRREGKEREGRSREGKEGRKEGRRWEQVVNIAKKHEALELGTQHTATTRVNKDCM
jgi:hypothetical protein